MERNMAWAHHRRGHSLGSVAVRDKDEDLALFKDMSKRSKPPFLRTGDQLLDHGSLSSKFGGLSHPHSAPPAERIGMGAELLNSDAGKTDYDWLMTPPGTPLFPSMDADAPALQHGALINRSLATIKTSRQASAAPRARSPAASATRGNPSPSRRSSTPQKSQLQAKQSPITTRPATPTRSSTPSSRASPQQLRPSTPTRQTPRPVTPLGARPATPTRRSPTPATPPSNRPSTPTLRRSISSPTGSRTGGHLRNPSPTRSTASTATSTATTRGQSPARPAGGPSPAPSSRGRSPSPASNVRMTPDRPSSSQRRPVAYGASPGDGHQLRRTPSPARSVTRVERVSRGETSDSESSFDTGSQSGVSAYGLVTPERRRMLGPHGTPKGRRSGSATSSSPQLGSSTSKKSFEAAAREYHRGQVAAFRPLMTNSSISTFYSSRASGLLRRPLTPSSTCSSSEHGATVAHDSDEDAGSINQWKPATKTSSGAHSPLHLFNKSIREASTLDASIVDDNDELSSFFRTPEALQVESMSVPFGNHHCKGEGLESPEFVSELNWLNSRNAHELDREYLKNFAAVPASKHGSPGLEKIRDKLRHLKSTVAESNEVDTQSAFPALETDSVGDHEVELLLQGASCEFCGHWKHNCHCTASATSATSTNSAIQAHEEAHEEAPSSSCNGETSDLKADNGAYAKERDIWYIYRHSSEYGVPVAGFSETKMEIDPPQMLAKEVHMRPSSSSVYSAKSENAGRNGHCKDNVTKENGTLENGKGLVVTGVESTKGREFGAATTCHASSMPELPNLKPERVTNIQGKQSAKDKIAQDYTSGENMISVPPLNSQYSSSVTHFANTVSHSIEGSSVKNPGHVEWGDQTFDADAGASPLRPEFSTKEEAKEPASACTTVDAHCSGEDHVSVVPQVKKIIWQEEDLQQLGIQLEAGRGLSKSADEKVELGWENGKGEDGYFVDGYHPDGSVEAQRQVVHTLGPNVKPKTTRADDSGPYCFEPLKLVGQKHLLTGEVHIDSAAHLSDDSLVIKFQSSDGRVLAVDNPARLISDPPNDMNSYAVYEYSHWAEVGARLTFSAHYGRREENSSREVLFYPREHEVHVTTDDKQPRIPKFQGRLGTFRKGSVVPALDGAQITAVAEKDSVAGDLKSAEIAVTCSKGVNGNGPLFDDFTLAGIHPSRPRNPEPLVLKASDSRGAQSTPDVPTANTVQEGNVVSLNGDLTQEVLVAKASSDELLDYILGSWREPCCAQPVRPEVLMPGAEILTSAIDKPSTFKGVNPSINSSDRLKTPPRSQSRETSTNCNARAVAELPVGVNNGLDSTLKCTSHADAAELPVGARNNRDTTTTSAFSADAAELPDGASNGRDTPTKSTPRADFVPKATVAVDAPVKEEIEEIADSSSPGTTRKHMSSFKFSHKKGGPSELKRSNTTIGSSLTKVGTQPVHPGSTSTKNNNNKVAGSGKPASPSPHLNKGRSFRASSPARPTANAPANVKAAAAPLVAGATTGEVLPSEQEPSIHSRFSNITVRSGSDTEIFDWGPSSLEETSSRCGSSAGPNAASMAVLSRTLSSSQPLEVDMTKGDTHHIDNEDKDDEAQASASSQSSVVSPKDGIQRNPSRSKSITAESSAKVDNSHMHPTERAHDHPHGPTSTVPNNNNNFNNFNNSDNNISSSSNKNFAPKQNLDKLSEKLEKLETFGARVLLRNPQQHFLHSPPPSHGSHSNSKPAASLVGNHLQSYPLVLSCRSSRSLGSVRLDGPKSAASPVPNKCRCSIL